LHHIAVAQIHGLVDEVEALAACPDTPEHPDLLEGRSQ